jgi:hypothetical protein
MKQNPVDSVKNEFQGIYAAVHDLSDEDILHGPDDLFLPHLKRMNRLAAMGVDELIAEEMLNDLEFKTELKLIAHLKRIFGLRMEIDYAKSIISDPNPWDRITHFDFYPNYLQLAHMEYRGANLNTGDHVAFIGCGPLPLSLISMCKQYGIKGTGLEQVPEYGVLAEEILKSLGLTRHIRIIQGDHFSLPFKEECQLVMVGADARPKDEIFARLADVLPTGARLSYRIYEKGLRRLMDYQSVFQLPPEFREFARFQPEPPVNNTSVFLIKDTI